MLLDEINILLFLLYKRADLPSLYHYFCIPPPKKVSFLSILPLWDKLYVNLSCEKYGGNLIVFDKESKLRS